jgi:hypothetical protein
VLGGLIVAKSRSLKSVVQQQLAMRAQIPQQTVMADMSPLLQSVATPLPEVKMTKGGGSGKGTGINLSMGGNTADASPKVGTKKAQALGEGFFSKGTTKASSTPTAGYEAMNYIRSLLKMFAG